MLIIVIMPEKKRPPVKRSGPSRIEKQDKKYITDKLKQLDKVSQHFSTSELIQLKKHVGSISDILINGNARAADYGIPMFMCKHCGSTFVSDRYFFKPFLKHLQVVHFIN